MKASKIDELNKVIGEFILKISKFEMPLLMEAPDIWQSILLSVSHLSDISILLEAICNNSTSQDLELYNKFAEANGLPPKKYLDGIKDVDIDLDKYTKKP